MQKWTNPVPFRMPPAAWYAFPVPTTPKRPGKRPVPRSNLHTAPRHLAALVDSFQASGRYVLTRDEALAQLGISDGALRKAVQRLVAKGRLAVPRRGFYVIVPLEHRAAGAPPPSSYVDALMRFHGQPYYVGLLSAAELLGAAHHRPQVFQVVTTRQLRPVSAGRGRIQFFGKAALARTPTLEHKTDTGTMRVSTPEATALDLVHYLEASGQLGHVATVLAELAEVMDARRLVEAAKVAEFPVAQRLGHLLSVVGPPALVEPLAAWIDAERPRTVALRTDRPARKASRDPRFRVLVNERVEAEP